MADNILDMAVRHLGSAGMGALGSALGLPADKSEGAFSTGVASVLAGMMGKAGSESGLGSLLNMATKSTEMDLSSPGDIFADAGRMTSLQDVGGNILGSLFGSKESGVFNVISSALGLDSTKSGSLLKVAAPVVMSIIGKLVKSKGLNMQGLASLLMGQKDSIKDYVPAGLMNELGVKSLDDFTGPAAEAAPRQAAATPPVERKSGFGKWLWPLLIALAVLWALNMCAKKEKMDDGTGGVVIEQQEEVVVDDATPPPADTTTTTPDTGTETPVGTIVGTEDFASSFRAYLAEAARDPNKEFLLKIVFPTDGTMPTAASLPDVQALIKIMQENPGLSVIIEGHTDSDGDAAANEELSKTRAEAVKKMLADAGVQAVRVTAVGVGAAKPVADNNTEEGKQKNRRIAVKVDKYTE
ncbi:DUF937 domain-containing protein [Microbulbifer agarilyticus]|uniref:OmpA family protein n=1 Tax=Microbulbifer agarilyticus TaxID=260552 RepID=UPI001C988A57|nr:OmpA family protein [Microbulbifer agarilyticus]MBY6190136.1 DUF937 domain-containing protein [Microbulbifer agarilyticus]